MKTGLVLEGGAMRGMYTAGVLDVFMEESIWPDACIGVSAGALFGVSYVSRQKGRTLRYSKRFNKDRRYMGIGSLIKTGNIVNTEFAYHIMPVSLDPFDSETFEKSGIPFWSVVTNLSTGKAEYLLFERMQQMDILRASGSMPFVSRPVELNGNLYLDGGVADPIPFKKMAALGYEKRIVILTRDISYRKEAMSPLLIDLFYHSHKEFASSLKNRHEKYNQSIEDLLESEKDGSVLVIRPSAPIRIGRLEKDPDELQRVYDMGTEDAKKMLPCVRAFLRE